MGISFYFGNKIEILFEKFAKNYGSFESTDPFKSPLVIVPNINLLKWIQMEYAKTNSICLGMELKFLENGIVKILSDLSDNGQASPLFLGSRDSHTEFQMMIMSALMDIRGYRLFGNYLGDPDSPDYPARLFQLSDRLTRYFREYEYQREDMVLSWQKGNETYKNSEMEHDQREIYRRIFLPGGYMDMPELKDVADITTLPRYAESVFSQLKKSNGKNYGRDIHVFGFSQISEFHYNILVRLSEYAEICVYQLSFRDGLTNKLTAGTPDQNNVYENSRSDLLNLWGEPSFDNMDILSGIISTAGKNHDISYRYLGAHYAGHSRTRGLLEALQTDVSGVYDNAKSRDDGSIRIFGCHDLFREAETVYNSIIYNMKTDPELKLTDIAVFVADMGLYKGPLKSVFLNSGIDRPETDIHAGQLIPFNLSDSNADEESAFGKTLLKMLKLSNNNFTRKDVFDLILNPVFLSSNGISRKIAVLWLEWISELNVVRGYDDSRFELYSWQQGFKRLRYGRIMTDDNPEDSSFKNFNGIIPFADMDSGNALALNIFSKTVETLLSRLKHFGNAKLSGSQWAEKLTSLINEYQQFHFLCFYLHYVMDNLLKSLDKLKIFDIINNNTGMLTLDSINEFVKQCLTDIPCSIGHYLTDGVTISSLIPLRPIPFKIIYIMGLNENIFPGFTDNSTIDLRNMEKRPGDISIPDANKYLFLETVMSARKKIYLSFVSRDNQKDEERLPSPVISQLKDHIQKISDVDIDIVEIPLKGYSKKYLYEKNKTLYPDLFENNSYSNNIILLQNAGSLDMFQKALIDSELTRMKKKFVFSNEYINDEETIKVSLKELVRFVFNPVDALIKRNLRLYGEEEDKSLAEYEPFFTNFPIDQNLINAALEYYIENNDPELEVNDFFNGIYDHYLLKSKVPSEEFGNIDRRILFGKISGRINAPGGLKTFLEAMKKYSFVRKFTLGDGNKEYGKSFPPVKFRIDGKDIEVSGDMDFIWIGDDRLISLSVTHSSRKNRLSRHIIRPFLFYLMTLCSDEKALPGNDSPAFDICLSYKPDNTRSMSTTNYMITHDAAHEYLSNLLYDYVFGKKYDLLPFPIISSIIARHNFDSSYLSKEHITEKMEEDAGSGYSDFNKSDLLDVINPEVPENAFDTISRRYKLIYSTTTGTQNSEELIRNRSNNQEED